jgi:Protein of unknown function (DUF3293)
VLRAYRLTQYRAAGIGFQIGRRAPEALFIRLGTPTATLLTAWNPRSRRQPIGCNCRMQQRLRKQLRRSIVAEADGTLHRWHEAMLLAAGDPRPAIRLARRFRQRAVVILRRGQTVELRCL